MKKYQNFYLKIFIFFLFIFFFFLVVVKFSVYLNRRVFVMLSDRHTYLGRLKRKRASEHAITKTRLFKYTENFATKKKKNFQLKKSDIFHISAQNIDCGYSLEPPRRGGSNEYPQSMFLAK